MGQNISNPFNAYKDCRTPSIKCSATTARSEAVSKTSFLHLPAELRLVIYAHLPETKIRLIRYPENPNHPGRSTLVRPNTLLKFRVHDKICNMSILRTCKTIYQDARPTILEQMGFQQNEARLHVACGRYLCKHTQLIELVGFAAFWSSRWNHDSEASAQLAGLSARIERRLLISQNTSAPVEFRLDYYPSTTVGNWVRREDWDILGSLKHLDDHSDVVVRVFAKGRLVLLGEYFVQVGTSRYSDVCYWRHKARINFGFKEDSGVRIRQAVMAPEDIGYFLG